MTITATTDRNFKVAGLQQPNPVLHATVVMYMHTAPGGYRRLLAYLYQEAPRRYFLKTCTGCSATPSMWQVSEYLRMPWPSPRPVLLRNCDQLDMATLNPWL